MSYLKKIEFVEDYRTFKKGEAIEIEKPLLILVGLNGCGKSTVLDCVRESLGIADTSYLKDSHAASYVKLTKVKKKFESKYYDFHSGDKKYASSFGDDIGAQMAAMKNSSGIGSLIQFHHTGIKTMKEGLIMLDEPDRGLALALQKKMMEMILGMVIMGKNQIIVSTHSEYLMDLGGTFGQIYSVEHKKFFDTKEDFLKEHLK